MTITITQPSHIEVHPMGSGLWRATIKRKGKPDLDAFGTSSTEALANAIESEER